MIDLKDYNVQPDEGLFEKIQHRLSVRRAVRIGGKVLAGIAVAAVAITVVAVLSLQDKGGTNQRQMAVSSRSTVSDGLRGEPSRTTPATTVGVHTGVRPAESDEPFTPNTMQAAQITPADTTATATDATPLEVTAPECRPSQVEPNETTRHDEAMTTSDKPATQTEVAAPDETKPTIASTTTKQPTESAKVGQQNTHYDNIIWAPNIIIPGGEVEENRVFSIQSTSAITEFSMQIFNRRGMRVYSTENTAFRWSAEGMSQGAYVWVATFRDSNGRQRQEKGTVLVVR